MTDDERVRLGATGTSADGRDDAATRADRATETTSGTDRATDTAADACADLTARADREITAEYHDEFYVADPGDTEVH
ncbi:hypothetical protein [Halarchaeum salinum]|uniref:hypothetical protein n=1 Tax=Halarchaeum salinum TaxID=489912 RepID=UPI001B87C91D